MSKIFIGILLAFGLLYGCANKLNKPDDEKVDEIIVSNTIEFNPEVIKDEDVVFYNLYSPVDISYLVTKDISFYNSTLLNPLNNITNYNESFKAALNLGIYGADLSYLWLFDQSQQAHSYLTAIQQLSDQLGIPRDFVDFTYADAQNHANNLDTLINIARESYYTAQKYLNETDRAYAANLILLGGWIETLYIATNMYDEPNPELVSLVATQNFSANSLYRLLLSSQNEADISEYLLLIRRVNKLYDDFNIQFPEGSLMIDTFKHRIFVSDEATIELTAEEFEAIRELTSQIRAYMVE